MTQPFEAPTAASSPPPVLATVLVVLVTTLGGFGLVMSLFGAVGLASSHLLAVSPEQAQLMAEIRAEQGWWVEPTNVAMLLLKLALSAGLVAGGAFTLAGSPTGRRILVPTLVFGIVYELAVGLFGLGSALINRDTMSGQFGRAMQADPNLPPDTAALAGTAFGTVMLVAMAVAFVWALAKAGLYEWTRRQLAGTQ